MITKINNAYNGLTHASKNHFTASEAHLRFKHTLEVAVLEAIYDGRINGKNEQARQAQSRELFPGMHFDVDNSSAQIRYTRHCLELAKLEVEHVRALLRLEELTRE